ncbi:MAG: hypothetical protein PHY60_05195 [Atopobiaceae bacterium]|nr:hypothetical protein [Atopobiaceae bacterium]MDD3485129.1 hypothetical protein [Atopobiaceae bacterium]
MPCSVAIVDTFRITDYPPIISLVENLLCNGHEVHLIGNCSSKLPELVLSNQHFHAHEISHYDGMASGQSAYEKFVNRSRTKEEVIAAVRSVMSTTDVLWTTSANAVRTLGDVVLDYRHVMQLMELQQYCYMYKKHIKVDIDKYARQAWKVVVPEINRAYIQQVWWGLKETPTVLPNKPYYTNPGEPSQEMIPFLEKMRDEDRRVMLYLGGIFIDRDLEQFAQAAKELESEYCLYVVGKAFEEKSQAYFDSLLERYPIQYCGAYPPPGHLNFVRYADIGLLPYKPCFSDGLSELNALYCAPNKIYEYAAFGIPMLGSDVLGLRQPFESYNIGRCTALDSDSIVRTVKEMQPLHDEMAANCQAFFEGVDLDAIVESILA